MHGRCSGSRCCLTADHKFEAELTHRWSLQLVATDHPTLSPTACSSVYSWRNLVFMHEHQRHGTRGQQQGDFRPFQPALLAGRISFTNRASLPGCGTCFPGRCKPPVPCLFLRKKIYPSLTLLSQARTFCRFVLETLPSITFLFFFLFFFFLFA